MEERKGGYEGSETVSPILPILLHESLQCIATTKKMGEGQG